MCKRSDVPPCSQSPIPAVAACGLWYPSAPIKYPGPEARVIESNLEGQMLEEMGSAVCFIRLCSATSINPNTDGRCLSPW